MKGRGVAGLLGLMVLIGALSCRGPMEAIKKDPDVLAVVGRYYVDRSDLKAALEYNQAGDSRDPLVKSRIFDGLVNDLLILNDAATGAPPPNPTPLGRYVNPKTREDEVSGVLQRAVYGKVTVTPGEVKHFYSTHLAEYRRGSGVLLRTIFLSGLKQAKEAERLLRRGHSFGDVARLYSLSPEKGAPRYFQYDELPDFLRAEVKGAAVGVPTKPIQVSSGFYQILLVERRYGRYVLPLEEAAPQIRLTLVDQKSDELYKAYLEKLRRRFKPMVFWSKLPFAYEKEKP